MPGLRLIAPIAAWALVLTTPVATATAQQPQPSPQGIEISGATHVEFDDASGIWQMQGAPVVATRGSATVRAPSLRYDSRQQILQATGGVTYTDDTITLAAAEITVWMKEDRALAEGDVTAVWREEDRETKVQSRRLEVWTQQRRAVGTGGVTAVRKNATITGDQLEYDDRRQWGMVTGDARVVTPDGTLSADRLEWRLDREEFTAEGNARLTHEDLEGQAPRAVLQQREGIAVLSGGATVRQGRNETRAQTVTVDLRGKRLTASGQAHIVVYPATPP